MSNIFLRKGTAFIASLLLASLLLGGCGREKGNHPQTGERAGGSQIQGGPLPVEVVTVKTEALPWTQTYPGRAEGYQRVEIYPRVGGIIIDRPYTEGTDVHQGDVLFQIDPKPYEVALRQANAQLQKTQANLRSAEREWNRARSLFETNALSERLRDNALSAYELAQADVEIAQANLSARQLDLDYTSVESPIDGVTSSERLPIGSLVNTGDALTTVTRLDPMYVNFSLPEGDPAYQQIVDKRVNLANITLSLTSRETLGNAIKGHINFKESRVDAQNGTIRLRAEFANSDKVLLPGQFVRVNFENLFLDEVAIIPEAAVLATSRGNMVYVVDKENKVAVRPVALGPVLEAGQLINKGLVAGDRVINSALLRIRPGMPVNPIESVPAAESAVK